VSPCVIDTPWLASLGEGKNGVIESMAALPIKRLDTAAEIAHTYVFLMTNRCVTGEGLHVDG
jgi:NAD(P)-dependent dehydrogenase (short-subunit alcohol dehydrogenase family)